MAQGNRRNFVAVNADGKVFSLSRWCGVKPKLLRAKLGDAGDLPTVDDAIGLLPENAEALDPATFPTKDSAFERALSDLVARQRDERKELETRLEARRLSEIENRQSRLPTGMRAVWAKLTGAYQHILTELAQDAAAGDTRDQAEMQALIDRHLAERRALDRQFADPYRALSDTLDQRERPIYRPDPSQFLVLQKDRPPFTAAQVRNDPSLILGHLSEKHAAFTRTDVLRALAVFIPDPTELGSVCDHAITSTDLVRLDDEAFTTRDYRSTETAMLADAKEMARLGNFRVRRSHLLSAIQAENKKLQTQHGAHLSDEQIAAIEHVLKPEQLSCVVGLAGAGKSTLLSAARAAWEKQGYRVHGAALAGKAADGLQSASGIKSRTLASLEASWKAGHEPMGAGDILVIDEAGMVGMRQLARVMDALKQRGSKLVLVGDPEQLQPIEAGTPFKQMVTETGAARLTDIRRQKDAWQRGASKDLADGNIAEALQAYQDRGAITSEQNRDHAVSALVEDYLSDMDANSDGTRLALAHRRVDVHAINQAIKSARRLRGHTPVETLFETEHGPRAFAEGDRLLFTRNDQTLGVRNGMLGTVVKVGDGQLSVALDQGDGSAPRRVCFSPQAYSSLDHGFAVSIHRSQGATVDRSFVLDSRTMDENLTYVAMTRHRRQTGLYTAPDVSKITRQLHPSDETRQVRRNGPSLGL